MQDEDSEMERVLIGAMRFGRGLREGVMAPIQAAMAVALAEEVLDMWDFGMQRYEILQMVADGRVDSAFPTFDVPVSEPGKDDEEWESDL